MAADKVAVFIDIKVFHLPAAVWVHVKKEYSVIQVAEIAKANCITVTLLI